jgi:AbiV family abortive infection protein
MTRALQNAARLAEDSETLLKAGRVPSAVALAILSIEESGKVAILRQMATAHEEKEWVELWRAYRSHTKKNTLWIFGELVQKGARTLDELRPLIDPDSDHPDILDQMKQLSIYSDCFKDAKWSSPADVDLHATAPYLVKVAQILGRAKNVTVDEIQLWQKYLLPVKDAPMATQKKAVTAWFHEMKLLGLSDASPEEVEAFLGRHNAPTQA